MARVGAEDLAVVQHDDGGGMALGARRVREFGPRGGGAVLDVAGNENSAGGRMNDTGVDPIRVGGIEREPEDRVPEIVQRLSRWRPGRSRR